MLNYRILKLSYTNISDRFNLSTLRIEDFFHDGEKDGESAAWSMRRFNMLLSSLMVPSDIALCFIAISAYQLADADTYLKKVAVERLCISLVLASLTLAEFILPQKSGDVGHSGSEQKQRIGIVSILPSGAATSSHGLGQNQKHSRNYQVLTNNSSLTMVTENDPLGANNKSAISHLLDTADYASK